jgi:hypothetical protein
MAWVARVLGAGALIVVGWAAATGWPAIWHGHPAYGILLAVTALIAAIVAWRGVRRMRAATGDDRAGLATSDRPRPARRVLKLLVAVLAIGWLAALVYLRPFSALEPAPAAMRSDGAVTVTESATQIVLRPTVTPDATAVFFQPGAKVETRAYAAVLRPLAQAGHPVFITKQPLGIAFLATGAFARARSAHPEITHWVVGGHSLGGVVAAMDADAHDGDATGRVTGLLLYASYPASDLSTTLACPVLSVSAGNDRLATPGKIADSQRTLPAATRFTVVAGAVHAFFGDYGPQPGDGTPTISHDEAREQISEASLAFVSGPAH